MVRVYVCMETMSQFGADFKHQIQSFLSKPEMEMHTDADVLRRKCRAVDGAVRLAMLLPTLTQREQDQLDSSLNCLREGVTAMFAFDPDMHVDLGMHVNPLNIRGSCKAMKFGHQTGADFVLHSLTERIYGCLGTWN